MTATDDTFCQDVFIPSKPIYSLFLPQVQFGAPIGFYQWRQVFRSEPVEPDPEPKMGKEFDMGKMMSMPVAAIKSFISTHEYFLSLFSR